MAESTRYHDWAVKWRLPTMGTVGRRIVGGFAAALADRSFDGARAARLETLAMSASETAIGMLAVDRGIVLGTSETLASKRERVARAPLQWRLAGSPLGMLTALHFAGFTGAVIVQQNGLSWRIEGTPALDDLEDLTVGPTWLTKQSTGFNPFIPASTDGRPAIAIGTVPWWSFDASHMDADGNQYTSRFGILFPSDRLPAGWAAAVSPPTAVSVPSKSEVNKMIRIMNAWRPGKAKPMWIKVVTSGNVWGWPLTMDWGDPGLVWGGTVVEFGVTEYA